MLYFLVLRVAQTNTQKTTFVIGMTKTLQQRTNKKISADNVWSVVSLGTTKNVQANDKHKCF